MFQPQATPYSPFASYGATPQSFAGFPSAPSVVDSGGSTSFRDPIFASNNTPRGSLPFNHNNSHQYPKMEGSDMEAQEALARDFQPALEVR
jgi:hypothetical protein